MPTTIITEEQWLKLKPILLDLNIYDKPSLKETFLGIIYRLKTGCPWRYLPNCYGKANTVFKAFRRWSASGLFYRLFKRLIKNADMEWVSIDATYVRAHQSSAGAAGGSEQGIAKSVGGNSSKIHLAVDAHGNPIEFIVGDGVTHDIKIAPALLRLLDLKDTAFLNADKGYDSDEFRDLVHLQGSHANIPRKKNAKTSNEHMDWMIYKARHAVENTFANLKHQRALSSRYDKLLNSYIGTVSLACGLIWLKL